jgi:hypothetical protein
MGSSSFHQSSAARIHRGRGLLGNAGVKNDQHEEVEFLVDDISHADFVEKKYVGSCISLSAVLQL